MYAAPPQEHQAHIEKAPTGISGIDEITGGGLPRGRATLLCGGPGCGKTLLAMEFLVRGVTVYGEQGVFFAFEETLGELAQNVASLGFDLNQLVTERQIAVDQAHFDPAAVAVASPYTLDGLFARLEYAIARVGARRVVLDAIEVLFSSLPEPGLVRAELQRLFRWLKERGLTAVVTAERGEASFTRSGLEEYVADCVILLDHRVIDQLSTRRLRIVKYRGTIHGTNEYPFMIGSSGFAVFPITSLGLDYEVTSERITSGIADLDVMLGNGGYYRGSTVLISGTAGSGKSSVAAAFAEAACRRGDRCLYIAFEEAPQQIMRNMRAIGIDLTPWHAQATLVFHADRPTICGLELHLARIVDLIQSFAPAVLVIDPISSLINQGQAAEVRSLVSRVIDLCKQRGVTVLMTSLTAGGENPERTEVEISSTADTWLLLRNLEHNGERNRGLYVLKSRGMAHSNQIREFQLSEQGIELIRPYMGEGAVLTGTARLAQEARERLESLNRAEELARSERELERRRHVLEAQIAALHADLAQIEADHALLAAKERRRAELTLATRGAMRRMRMAGDEQHEHNSVAEGEP